MDPVSCLCLFLVVTSQSWVGAAPAAAPAPATPPRPAPGPGPVTSPVKRAAAGFSCDKSGIYADQSTGCQVSKA